MEGDEDEEDEEEGGGGEKEREREVDEEEEEEEEEEEDEEREEEGDEEEEGEEEVWERGIPGPFKKDETMVSRSFSFCVKLLKVCKMRFLSTQSIVINLSMFVA